MEQVCLIIGAACSVVGLVLAFLRDWRVEIVRRDDPERGCKGKK